MADGTRNQKFKREVFQVIQDAEQRQQKLLQESIDGIKGLITGLSLQQSRAYSKQRGHEADDEGTGQSSGSKMPWGRSTKLEVPRFNREYFDRWLLRAEYFFKVDDIAQENWVKVATLHLDGKAIQWHQGFIRAQGGKETTWDEYVLLLKARFGAQAYDDPLADLRVEKPKE